MTKPTRSDWPPSKYKTTREWLTDLARQSGDPRLAPPKTAEPKPPPEAAGVDFGQQPGKLR